MVWNAEHGGLRLFTVLLPIRRRGKVENGDSSEGRFKGGRISSPRLSGRLLHVPGISSSSLSLRCTLWFAPMVGLTPAAFFAVPDPVHRPPLLLMLNDEC